MVCRNGKWLTPDTLPATTVTVTIQCPDDDDLIACVVGALSELAYYENWQEFGTQTPIDVAHLMSYFVIGVTVT